MAAYRRSRGLGGPPLKEGAIAGFASFVGGYIVTLVVVALGESDELTENLAQAAGWLYYNAQFASLQVTAQAGGQSRSSTFNYLTDSTLFSQSVDSVSVPTVVYHLIPIVVLVGAGVVLAGYVDARDFQEGAIAGATLAVGTVLPALLGTILFSVELSGFGFTVEQSPALVEGVILVGLLYPAVFGAIGGIITTEL
jgi:hypothetical protein